MKERDKIQIQCLEREKSLYSDRSSGEWKDDLSGKDSGRRSSSV